MNGLRPAAYFCALVIPTVVLLAVSDQLDPLAVVFTVLGGLGAAVVVDCWIIWGRFGFASRRAARRSRRRRTKLTPHGN